MSKIAGRRLEKDNNNQMQVNGRVLTVIFMVAGFADNFLYIH
jgi:hypothetical protein